MSSPLGVCFAWVVSDGGCGGGPFECAVGSVLIVVVLEAFVGFCALCLRCPGSLVGLFFEQGPVEAFDFAVGLWTIGPGTLVAGTGGSHGFEPEAAAVAATVVGEYPLDGHTTLCEPGVGTLAGILLLCDLFRL